MENKFNIIKDGTEVVTCNDVDSKVCNYIIPASVKRIEAGVIRFNEEGYNSIFYTGTIEQFKEIDIDKDSFKYVMCVNCADGSKIFHL